MFYSDIDMSGKGVFMGIINVTKFQNLGQYTVDNYILYLKEYDDTDSKECNNPAPIDGIKISQLKEMTDDELLGIINKAGATDNKSDIRVMFSMGFAFSWTKLLVIAEYRGFVKISENSRIVKYEKTGISEKEYHIPEISSKDNYLLSIAHSKTEKTCEKKITLKKSTLKKIDELVKGTDAAASKILRSRILNAILDRALDFYLEKKKAGKPIVVFAKVESTQII